jgi:uncharacterized repeat protein (TIGR03803 family)
MIASQKRSGAAVLRNRLPSVRRGLALAGGCWLLALGASGQSFDILYSFSSAANNAVGRNPSSLTLSTNGNFYGTCVNEGTQGWGAIYQMTAAGTPAPLYSFTNGSDGANPYAGLTQGTNGLFYGLAQSGGSNAYGTIFDVKTNGTFSSLYSFASLAYDSKTAQLTNANGAAPQSPLVLNSNNGNFYGTAPDGGANGYGTVFQVTHQGKVTVFYSFSNLVDGAYPEAALLLYTDGNLYGTASGGGSNSPGYGTIFQVTAAGQVKAIYSFTNGSDGAAPQGALIDGKDGHLYGTCSAGGSNGTGTIFKITTNGVLTALYSFSPGAQFPNTQGIENQYNADGINPKGLLLGSDGNFYGVAYYGGANGSGTVFQFTKSGALNVLYAFSYSGSQPNSDGANPVSLVQYTNGNFYGTAYEGGTNGAGAFFTVGLPPTITDQPTNQSIALHSNAIFSLTAAAALSCQWQFDSANLPNATNYTLSITNAQVTNAGSYQAIVTNSNGATTSAVVTLSLTNVPVSFLAGPGASQYSGGQFSLRLTNLTGQGAVILEASSNLLQWTPIYTNPSGFGAASFIDAAAANYPFRYYRALTP